MATIRVHIIVMDPEVSPQNALRNSVEIAVATPVRIAARKTPARKENPSSRNARVTIAEKINGSSIASSNLAAACRPHGLLQTPTPPIRDQSLCEPYLLMTIPMEQPTQVESRRGRGMGCQRGHANRKQPPRVISISSSAVRD